MQAVRTKRSAASKDTLPDEVFHRIRGALFFGPGFKVTRNKLLFRDNLQELLAAAVPGVHNPQTWTVLSMQLFALLPTVRALMSSSSSCQGLVKMILGDLT